jgi:hypothetical protein
MDSITVSSVADPGCLSRIRIFSIPDSNFFNPGSRIQGSKTKKAPGPGPVTLTVSSLLMNVSDWQKCLKTLFLPPGAAAAEFETRPKRKSGSLPELGLAALPPKKQRPEEEEEGDVMEVGLSRNVRRISFLISRNEVGEIFLAQY